MLSRFSTILWKQYKNAAFSSIKCFNTPVTVVIANILDK